MIGITSIGYGYATIFQAALNYLVDTYQDFAASAVAANTFLRCMLAGAFPLTAHPCTWFFLPASLHTSLTLRVGKLRRGPVFDTLPLQSLPFHAAAGISPSSSSVFSSTPIPFILLFPTFPSPASSHAVSLLLSTLHSPLLSPRPFLIQPPFLLNQPHTIKVITDES